METHTIERSIYTVAEVARILGVSRTTVYANIRADDGIPHRHIGRRVVVPVDEFHHWLNPRQRPAFLVDVTSRKVG